MYTGICVGMFSPIQFIFEENPAWHVILIPSGWNGKYWEIIEFGDIDDYHAQLLTKDELEEKYTHVEFEDFESPDINCCCGHCE